MPRTMMTTTTTSPSSCRNPRSSRMCRCSRSERQSSRRSARSWAQARRWRSNQSRSRSTTSSQDRPGPDHKRGAESATRNVRHESSLHPRRASVSPVDPNVQHSPLPPRQEQHPQRRILSFGTDTSTSRTAGADTATGERGADGEGHRRRGPGARAQPQLGDDLRDATRCAASRDRGLHADRGGEHVPRGYRRRARRAGPTAAGPPRVADDAARPRLLSAQELPAPSRQRPRL